MHRIVFSILISVLSITAYAKSSSEFIVVTNIWKPYIMQPGAKLPGYLQELVDKAFRDAKLDPQIKIIEWNKALQQTATGQANAIFPLYYTPQRAQVYAYSDPIIAGQIAIFKRINDDIEFPVQRPDLDWVATFNKMKKYRFGVVKGYANTEEFDQNKQLKKVFVASDKENMQQLLDGKVDLVVMDKLVAQYLLNEVLPDDARHQVTAMRPAIGQNKVHVGFSREKKDYQQSIDAFNQSLKRLQQQRVPQEIMIKYLGSFIDQQKVPKKR